ncbi:uncharacterized protein LOC143912993 [Arctopsyche grandis]|uniref:uncharacterized protein LOC143912993 n=1 Tax=Arctopsyche grandis TaxID=121162 RepID=UPI00406D94B5
MGNFQKIFFCLAITVVFASVDGQDGYSQDYPPMTTDSPSEPITDTITETPPEVTTIPPPESTTESATTVCPPNEVPSKCGNCRKTCSIRQLNPECLCVPGCICEPGYLRDFQGVCVPENKCDSPCNGDLGRVFDPCGNSCGRTCENIKDPNWECKPICVVDGECRCRDDLVENAAGHCVKPEDCGKTCDYNEGYSECMANDCEDTCMEPTKRFYCPYPFCKSGCACIPSTIRDDNGVCIPLSLCSESCNGDENAVTLPCTPSQALTCANLNEEPVLPSDFCDEIKTCGCKDGYALLEGKCIPRKFCPKCEKNELFLCRACELIADSVIDLKCTESFPCTEDCYCKLGYARDSDKNCVRLSEVDQKSCGDDPNAFFDQCDLDCEKTCENRNGPVDCVKGKCALEGKCLCKDGFVKNSEGKCIAPEMCDYKPRSFMPMKYQTSEPETDEKDSPNEINELPDTPQESIPTPTIRMMDHKWRPNENYHAQPDIPQDYSSKPTIPMNDDENSSKETSNEQPNDPDIPERGRRRRFKKKCGLNEVYNEQTYLPQENTCEMYLSGQQPSYTGEQCTPGCRCATGYLRNKSGACVMPENCCEDPNAELVPGPNTCPGGTCSCPMFEDCENRPWVPYGCQCKTGYLKISDTNPTCVPVDECCNYA